VVCISVGKRLVQLADDLLASGYVDLYLFLSIIFLILFTRLLGFSDAFSIALFSTVSMPAMYSFMYYYRKPLAGLFVKPKRAGVVRLRAAYRSLAASLTSFVTGFIVFAALSGSTNIAVYTIAFLVTWLQRTALYYMLSALAERIDIESPATLIAVSALAALIALAVLLAVAALLRL
jgi:hypothetical protein